MSGRYIAVGKEIVELPRPGSVYQEAVNEATVLGDRYRACASSARWPPDRSKSAWSGVGRNHMMIRGVRSSSDEDVVELWKPPRRDSAVSSGRCGDGGHLCVAEVYADDRSYGHDEYCRVL
ncbi:hypothetical protein SAMN04487905_11869 [Actinopolyspora xinjiangensis]|uniref:Uncharacterized protein n=1 Tax=Actinopolyspora xinjiangensis TaxID=405564 RepID=A0A1H0X083_9ACTN|nr:hypothetical protein SAMN04487905_11869 [Actinopolyspora xinjiangensis]